MEILGGSGDDHHAPTNPMGIHRLQFHNVIPFLLYNAPGAAAMPDERVLA
jgi:hypothetical protein